MDDLPKAFDPKQADGIWGAFWEEHGFFHADSKSKSPPFSIVMPPPNVTGVLHMGHALVSTLQDILARWKRMQGYEVLWVPGTDHAGIATQTVVERHLIKTEGKRRKEYSREAFLKHVWEWKEAREGTILSQLRQIGCSCDWSRLRFTMDAGCSRAVRKAFKNLYDKDLIYRGDYLVNWDPVTGTALADDEVEYEEQQSSLWTLRYHLVDEPGYLLIATTRPETLFGDTAVAVSPKDPRYAHLVGKKVHLPLTERTLPIITDHHVDPEFGTGALKVTPAHDPNDYRMGIEHDLPMINIFTADGRMNANGGAFEGLSREEARRKVVEELKQQGLLESIHPHTHRVGISYRSKAVIEPMLSKQWFVRMEPFKEKLHNTSVKILPSSWRATYEHWIHNLRDWCISRQLWWGHRIPVWKHRTDGRLICHGDEGTPAEVAQDPDSWEQDPDVLDTWFSSALWPFSTLGWPDKSADLEKFYPTSFLITGHDILFFWVARMIALGDACMERPPFSKVFLHGLIYGKSYWHADTGHYVTGEEKRAYDTGTPLPKGVLSKWEKLSKSKGNVIDPLEMIETYGTDAVRMSLCASANQSPQIDLDRRRFEDYKNFANKIWNGARFVFMHLKDLDYSCGIDTTLLGLEDRWILSALNRINCDVNKALENFHFEGAAKGSYDFFWKEFCAYYVEMAKPVLFGDHVQKRQNTQKILTVILCNMLRLLHPMVPFITEELFQKLKEHFPKIEGDDPYTLATKQALAAPACIVAPYPTLICEEDLQPQIEEAFSKIEQIVYTIRNIRGEMKIPPGVETDVYLVGEKVEIAPICALVRSCLVHAVDEVPALPFCATGRVGGIHIIIPLPEALRAKEQGRLEKERERLEEGVKRQQALLKNAAFLEKAKPQLVEKKRAELQEMQSTLETIVQKLESFTS